MKKIIFTFLIAGFGLTTSLKADGEPKITQPISKKGNSSGEKCFDENTHIINVGIGIPRWYYGLINSPGYTHFITPALSISYEQAYKKKLGPGYLGVGAYFGYQGAWQKYTFNDWYNGTYGTYYYQHQWNYFSVAARGVYHWDVLNSKNAEVYAGVIVGLRFQTYSYTTNDPDPYYNNFRLSQGAVYPSYSVFAGARWYFAKNFGLFAEAGYGISYLSGGLSIKF